LIERLNEGLQRKLTLVSAPAGFGKTTLVSTWLDKCGQPAAWLSLDAGDNDPARFLTYLIAAIHTVSAHVGDGVLEMLQSPQSPPQDSILTILLNEITAVETHFVLVLDDYHVINAQVIDHALTFLLEHMPPQMHLVIATREDPDVPLARLRARGQLVELRAADLRFTPAESAEFLNRAMGLKLSAEDIAALDTRTEGWIVGLQLAALSMQDRADTAHFIQTFTGSHRFVLDYLIEEVLQRQPKAVFRFLLPTAILERLSGPLCDTVTGRDDGGAMLEALERANLFVIPLDDGRQWYRYHHLFAEVLQMRLMEEQPHQVPSLHQRASLWYEQNGLPSDAIHHALAAQDLERAAKLIELAWSAMDINQQSATWLGWVRRLPEELIMNRPVLSVGYAWALLDSGDMDSCEARLRDAEEWLDASTPKEESHGTYSNEMVVVDEEQFRSLPASIATARAYRALALGDILGTLEYAQRALSLTPEHDKIRYIQATSLLGITQYASGDVEAADRSLTSFLAYLRKADKLSTVIGITFVLADIKRARGRLHDAVGVYQSTLQLTASQGEPMPIGTADLYRGLSELYCEWGKLETATQHLLTSKNLGEQAPLIGWPHRLCITEAQLSEAQGELDRALDLLNEAERRYVRTPLPDVRPITALKTRVWLRQGKLSEAAEWVREQGLSASDDLSYLHEFDHIALARVLIAQHKYGQAGGGILEAAGLLERLYQEAELSGRTGSLIEILILKALVYEARDDVSRALIFLERALTLAEPEGYVRLFVDEGPPMAALLREAAKRGIAPNYVSQLRAAFGHAEDRVAVTQLLIEPLSERELDVLKLLSTDLSGPEIALNLMVSLATVRTHTQNIYTKLGVNNRRTALRRAEELNLL
jgi:LuxR family maltose regulon positive regulatory protein